MTKAPEGSWGIFDQFGHGSTMLRDLSQNENILTAGGNLPTKFVRADLYEAQAAEIERLRGDLAKAVAMLDKTRLVLAEWEPHPFPVLAQVRATLAELTGGKDE